MKPIATVYSGSLNNRPPPKKPDPPFLRDIIFRTPSRRGRLNIPDPPSNMASAIVHDGGDLGDNGGDTWLDANANVEVESHC